MSYTSQFDDYRQMIGADYEDHLPDHDEDDLDMMCEIEFDEDEDEEDIPRDQSTGDPWHDMGLTWSMFY